MKKNFMIMTLATMIAGGIFLEAKGFDHAFVQEVYANQYTHEDILAYNWNENDASYPREYQNGLLAVSTFDEQTQTSVPRFLDREGNEVPFDYQANMFIYGFLIVQEDGKYGAVNHNLELVIPCIYDELNPQYTTQFGDIEFDGRIYFYATLDGKQGIIDHNGTEIIPFSYDAISRMDQYIASVQKGDYWGFVNFHGEEITNFIYDTSSTFQKEGVAVVRKDELYGLINWRGEEILPCAYQYLSVDSFSYMIYATETDGTSKNFYLDQNGNLVDKTEQKIVYEKAFNWTQDMSTRLWGCVNQNGEQVIPYLYTQANDFSDGLALVYSDQRYYYIDETGAEIISLDSYDMPRYMSYGQYNMGGMNEVGVYAKPVYQNFENGFVCVERDGKRGLMDTTGAEIIPCIYDGFSVGNITEGIILANKKDEYCVALNLQGEEISKRYQYIYWFLEGLSIVVSEENLYGYMDKTGAEIIPCIYEAPEELGVLWSISAGGSMEGMMSVVYQGQKCFLKNPLTTGSAIASNSPILIDGIEKEFDAFLIYDNNYFKLRDLAYVFNGTDGQFNIGWDNNLNAIHIITQQEYEPVGTEMSLADGLTKDFEKSYVNVYVDGVKTDFMMYNIGGNTYFKLRDLCSVVDVQVGFENGMILLNTK